MPNHPGVYFIPKANAYHVKIFLQGKQYYLRTAKTEQEATQAFDAALWRLQAFTSSRMKPSDVAGFNLITQADVDTHCPFANTLYDRFVKELDAQGVTVQSLLEARSMSLNNPVKMIWPTNPSRAPFFNFKRGVFKVHNSATQLKFNLRLAHQSVSFTKFPELSRQYEELISQLTKLEDTAFELSEQLESHTAVYEKLPA